MTSGLSAHRPSVVGAFDFTAYLSIQRVKYFDDAIFMGNLHGTLLNTNSPTLHVKGTLGVRSTLSPGSGMRRTVIAEAGSLGYFDSDGIHSSQLRHFE